MLDLASLLKKSNVSIGQPRNNDGPNFERIPSEMNGYKLFYPMGGSKVSLRILFNPASSSLLRDIRRHEYMPNAPKNEFKVKAPCLKAYDMDCPICNTIKTIEDSEKSSELSQCHKFTKRFISFAYINEVKQKPADQDVKAGDIVLFMYPMTIATEINEILKSCDGNEENFRKFFFSNNSLSFNISVDSTPSPTMYKIVPDAIMGQTKLFETDTEYENMINKLPSLDTMLLPATFNENYLTLAKQVSDSLSKKLLSGSIEQTTLNNIDAEGRAAEALKTARQINDAIAQAQPQIQETMVIQPIEQNVQPVINQVSTSNPEPVSIQAQPQPEIQSQIVQSSSPACLGQYNELEAKCLICAHSVECSTKSIK